MGGVVATSLDIEAGAGLDVEYSANGTTGWHAAPFVTGDVFMRQRVGTAGAWSDAIRIVGETGAAGAPGSTGNYIDFVFRRSANVPPTPAGSSPAGWFDSPPTSDGTPLWVSTAEKNAAGAVIGAWSAPTLFARDGELWIARGNAVASIASFFKVGGVSAWDSDIYSQVGFTSCHLTFKVNRTDGYVMCGFNSDPGTDSSYTSLDNCWYAQQGGAVNIYEGGSGVSGAWGTYTTDTEFGLTYDGTNVRYYKDAVLMRTVAASGAKFLDSSLYTPGCGLNSVKFGPGAVLPSVSTGQIAPNAATDTYESISSGITTITNFGSVNKCVITFTPKASGIASITAVGSKSAGSGTHITALGVTALHSGDIVEVVSDAKLPQAEGRFMVRGLLSVGEGAVYQITMQVYGYDGAGSTNFFDSRLIIELIKR
jgi:hypothetical protein